MGPSGLIGTKRLFDHVIAMQAVGPCAAAAADFVKFTDSAFALVAGLIAELTKMGALPPNHGKGSLQHIAAVERQVAAGLHLPRVADEAEPRAAEAAPGEGVHAECLRRDSHPLVVGALPQNSIIVRGTGGFKVHIRCFAEIVEPMQHIFIFPRGNYLVCHPRRAAHGYQQKNVPGRSSEAPTKVKNFFELPQIVPHDGGVDLKRQAHGLQIPDAAHGSVKSAQHAAKGVMTGGIRSVNGNGTPVHPGSLDLPSIARVDEGAIGRKGADKPLAAGIGYKLVHVWAQHGLSTRKNNDGTAHFGECVDERTGLSCGEFARIWSFVGLRTAVSARQIAGTGDFPRNQSADGVVCFRNARSLLVAPAATGTGMFRQRANPCLTISSA